MATHLQSFEIESPQLGKTFKIDLVQGLDDTHIEFIEQQWSPALKRQKDLAMLNFFQLPEVEQTPARWQEMLGAFGAPDQHWIWRTKCTVAPGTNRQVLALLNSDDVEAAMLLAFGRSSREGPSLPIVYVDYVAVAPWNRTPIQSPQRFHGLGTLMLGVAIATSISLGHEGRCGLHSLPASEGFYRRIGMRDLGIDATYHSLAYFEYTAEAAKHFVQTGDL